jgi:hydroxypyruvate isomerase
LLEAALRKLNHDDMKVDSMAVADFAKARQLASDIQKRAKEIDVDIYDAQKNHKSLATKR